MEKTVKRKIALLDTGVVYAMADEGDSWHKRVKEFLEQSDDMLLLPSAVVPEVCYLLNSYLGWEAEHKFLDSLLKGEMGLEHFNKEDLTRTNELLKKYSDVNIGFVDASIIAVAERLKIIKILTTDRRHFSIVKPSHCQSFTLLP